MEQITIKWEHGTEKINVDLSRLGDKDYEITETCQNSAGRLATYVTSSSATHLGECRFKVRIVYGKEVNLAAQQFNSPWGNTTLELYQGITKGTAYWRDDRLCLRGELPFNVETVSMVDGDPFAFLGESEEDWAVMEARRKQWLFRLNVQFWEQRCRVTGIENPEFLIASRMKAWHDAEEREKTAGYNGLLLAPHIGHLFDNHFISFADSGELLVSERLPEALRAALIPAKREKARSFASAQLLFLRIHRKRFVELNKTG